MNFEILKKEKKMTIGVEIHKPQKKYNMRIYITYECNINGLTNIGGCH